MGKVKTTWLLPGHSGRACNHENIYTKQDKKTNKVYSVKLCNPNEEWSGKQLKQRSEFGIISAALAAWIKTNKEADSDDYKKIMAQFDRQTKYSTLRGMMYAKGMAKLEDDGSVTITIGNSASSVTVNNGNQGSSTTDPGTSGSGSSNPQPGGDIDYGGQGYM